MSLINQAHSWSRLIRLIPGPLISRYRRKLARMSLSKPMLNIGRSMKCRRLTGWVATYPSMLSKIKISQSLLGDSGTLSTLVNGPTRSNDLKTVITLLYFSNENLTQQLHKVLPDQTFWIFDGNHKYINTISANRFEGKFNKTRNTINPLSFHSIARKGTSNSNPLWHLPVQYCFIATRLH